MDDRRSFTDGAGAFAKGLRAIAAALPAVLVALPVLAVSKDVNLDGITGNESVVSTNVLTTSPVKIQNKINNKAVGQAFTFIWKSAGPGGFQSSLALGTTAGVGTVWTWQTMNQVYAFTGSTACPNSNDICFTRRSDSARRGPFGVPGRSLTATNITVTNESLTSSLITFFSPPQELFRYTSSVEMLAPGVFRYKTILENLTGQDLTVDQSPGPIDCDTECGNSVREGQEVCDGSDLNGASCGDFDSVGTLGCAEDCRAYDLSGCTPSACGNDVREPGEVCDGSDLGDQSCGNFGGGGTLACRSSCDEFDLSGCNNVCGNGVQDDHEDCDGSDLGGADCDSVGGSLAHPPSQLGGTLACYDNCSFNITGCPDVCGNGTIDVGETCDGANLGGASCADVGQGGDVQCSSSCQVDYGSCSPYFCGNNTVDTKDEECDGSDLNDRTCESFGASGGTLACSQCSFDFSGCTDVCGNGVTEGEEQCDGSDLDGRTCADFGGDGTLSCSGGCSFYTAGCFPQGTIDCERPGSSTPVPAGSQVETCEISAHPAKEITTKIAVCGDSIPDGPDSCGTEEASSGTANTFIPDLDTTIGPVFFTSGDVQVVDVDGDGVPQPGQTVQIFIPLLNVGTQAVSNVRAVLSSPAYDIDLDGDQDPVVINVDTALYPNGPCFAGFQAGSGNCNSIFTPRSSCNNLTPFVVTFPADHPKDVGRKFVLTIFYDQTTLGATSPVTQPLVLGVGGSICGDGIREGDEECDDGNRLNGDCCSSSCQFESPGSLCEDGNPCTTGDTCNEGVCVSGGLLDCDDENSCTDDSCSFSSGCVNAPNVLPCDDGSVCTTDDACSGGSCHGGSALDCNDGNVCTTDTCDATAGCIHACNNDCNAKGDGYWKHLCKNRPDPSDDHAADGDDHSDDHSEFYTERDVDCVNDSCTFSDVQTIDQLCAELDDHSSDKCEKAEKKFMALLLNVCRCRLQPGQTIDTHCDPRHQTVGEVVAHEDATLCNPNRTQEQCRHPECAIDGIVSGEALWQNTLRLTRRTDGVLLTWQAVYGPPTSEAARKYRIWRRVFGTTGAYTKIGEVNEHTFSFLDTTAGAGSYTYEVTATY